MCIRDSNIIMDNSLKGNTFAVEGELIERPVKIFLVKKSELSKANPLRRISNHLFKRFYSNETVQNPSVTFKARSSHSHYKSAMEQGTKRSNIRLLKDPNESLSKLAKQRTRLHKKREHSFQPNSTFIYSKVTLKNCERNCFSVNKKEERVHPHSIRELRMKAILDELFYKSPKDISLYKVGKPKKPYYALKNNDFFRRLDIYSIKHKVSKYLRSEHSLH
eukprot:TRINITY_DN4448_c0_g2_i6.p1 TRINITY_DN4448_c0_g2~~TRINITY_DN4448_c0_g2_i6.p1  ORF type:complete len:220 (-),score=29.74 TRINITY_DN4448_c0_g2_i6:60-719(-)